MNGVIFPLACAFGLPFGPLSDELLYLLGVNTYEADPDSRDMMALKDTEKIFPLRGVRFPRLRNLESTSAVGKNHAMTAFIYCVFDVFNAFEA